MHPIDFLLPASLMGEGEGRCQQNLRCFDFALYQLARHLQPPYSPHASQPAFYLVFFPCRYDFVWGAEPSHLDEWHTARPGIVLSNYIPFARDPNTTLRGPSGLRWVYVGAQLLVR